ncbi:hypothetical protein [Stieleria varia]|uniref:Uncharacterized protein n=1 Tax=Stieleria varia TaxID=2528005 RepID=A0A5C5ZXS4_9BACT|nr:hypothetical protein [Stieleria varia]TWT91946.1 hypothetical protein Pla52n_64190 [Stieleria varia]
MPRPPRADEAGGLYHALNRGNLRATIFHKDADYAAFEWVQKKVAGVQKKVAGLFFASRSMFSLLT